MIVEPINYLQYADWLDDLDLISPSRPWCDFLKRQYGAEPEFLGFWENGKCRFILPAYRLGNDLVGTPRLYTEPLAYCSNGQFPWSDLAVYLHDQKSASLARFDLGAITEPSQAMFWREAGLKQSGVCHVLKLAGTAGEQAVLEGIVSHKTRNQIRAAYRRGGFQRLFNRDLNAFYVFYCRQIGRLGARPKTEKFFADLGQSFGEKLRIIFATVNGEIAGANLCLLHNRYLHLMFSVADRCWFKDYVSDWLYWETIKLGLAASIRTFDFGPSALGDHSHQRFKAGFGARPLPLYRIAIYHSFARQARDWFSAKARNLGLRLRKH